MVTVFVAIVSGVGTPVGLVNVSLDAFQCYLLLITLTQRFSVVARHSQE
jgi:hypothetical protein